jgi:hypothetical protein
MMPGASRLMPILYCSDAAVQRFIAAEMLDFDGASAKAPIELRDAALARYSYRRCDDLKYWIH